MVRAERIWRVPKRKLPINLREGGLNSKEVRHVKKLAKNIENHIDMIAFIDNNINNFIEEQNDFIAEVFHTVT